MKKKSKNGTKSSAQSDSMQPGLQKGRIMWQWLLFFLIGVSFFLLVYWGKLNSESFVSSQIVNPQVAELKSPQSLDELLKLPPAKLDRCDIGLIDLLCAQGLPGAENINIPDCMASLDQWAAHVQSETERNLHRFRENPAEFYNSEGYFRMLIMAVVVYEDFGIRYNPNRITLPGQIDPNDRFFANSQDIFLNGLIEGHKMGTCSSMPVLYIAIGRRLGYPLKLVTTKAHLFVRWEGAADRFNVETTGKGMNRYDDGHFKQWPFPVTDAEIQSDGFLKSLTASEELAVFLSLRGNCLKASGRLQEAAHCFAQASRLAPTWNAYHALLADTQAAASPSVTQPNDFHSAPAGQMDVNQFGTTSVGPDPNPLQQINKQPMK